LLRPAIVVLVKTDAHPIEIDFFKCQVWGIDDALKAVIEALERLVLATATKSHHRQGRSESDGQKGAFSQFDQHA